MGHFADFITLAAEILATPIVNMDGVDITLGFMLSVALIIWLLFVGLGMITGGQFGDSDQ